MIMQIIPAMNQGGVERGTVEIAAALQKANIKNCVVSEGGRLVAELERLGVEHITLPVASKNPVTIMRNARRIVCAAKTRGVKLMHVRSRAPAWSVAAASKQTGIPFVSTYHGVYGTKPGWLKIPYNRIMLKGAKVIAPSDFVRRHILETYRPAAEKIIVIPRGADTETFNPDRIDSARRAEVRASYGIAPDVPLLTMVGRLTRIKGQLLLVEALKKIKPRKLAVLFVGSDQGRVEYTRELEDRLAGLPSEISTQIVQTSPDMPETYAASDIVINASLVPEAFGRTIPEAQAMGCVVVAAKHGGACETVEDEKTGFLFAPGSASELAARIDSLLAAPSGELDRIRQQARQTAREKFSTQKMCDSTISLYRSLMD